MSFLSKSKEKEAVLEIHPGLILKGELTLAKDVLLTGKFEGDLRTAGCLTVTAGGTARGSIEAGALILEPGNQVEAMVKVTSSVPIKPFAPARKIGGGKWSLKLKKLKELIVGRN